MGSYESPLPQDADVCKTSQAREVNRFRAVSKVWKRENRNRLIQSLKLDSKKRFQKFIGRLPKIRRDSIRLSQMVTAAKESEQAYASPYAIIRQTELASRPLLEKFLQRTLMYQPLQRLPPAPIAPPQISMADRASAADGDDASVMEASEAGTESEGGSVAAAPEKPPVPRPPKKNVQLPLKMLSSSGLPGAPGAPVLPGVPSVLNLPLLPPVNAVPAAAAAQIPESK
eukprot:ANDGO_08470.mRNA.1 hypothetical protein